MVWILIVALLVSADQLSKALIVSEIPIEGSIPVIDGFLYLIHRVNAGGAWSLFAEHEWGLIALTVISSIASVGIVVMLFVWKRPGIRVCLSLILAGSLGNLVDRIIYKGVTDFISFHFGSYVFPTFNVADMCIVCGTILMFLFMLLHPEWLGNDTRQNIVADPE